MSFDRTPALASAFFHAFHPRVLGRDWIWAKNTTQRWFARSRPLPEPWIFFLDRSLGGRLVSEALRAQQAPHSLWHLIRGRVLGVSPSLVLDTNVALEIISRGDLWRAFAASKEALTEDGRERLFRAQCALALLYWLHRERVITVTCARELVEVSTNSEYFSPKQDDRPVLQRLGGAEIGLFLQRLHSCFDGWAFSDDNTAPAEARGSALDSWYVDRAQSYNCPLLSNEGWLPNGEVDEKKGIRKKARAAQIPIFTTRDFLLGRGVPIRDYADRCVTRILRCLANQKKPAPPLRIYELRYMAQFRCPCSRPNRYGVYCCPHLKFRPDI